MHRHRRNRIDRGTSLQILVVLDELYPPVTDHQFILALSVDRFHLRVAWRLSGRRISRPCFLRSGRFARFPAIEFHCAAAHTNSTRIVLGISPPFAPVSSLRASLGT